MSWQYIVTLLTCRVYHVKCKAGWSASWSQDCWEKYQQPQICRSYHPNGREWRGTKSLLMKVKDEGEKTGLKLNIQVSGHRCNHFMVIRWGNNGIVTDWIFLGSKITAGGACIHEIKRHLLLGKRAMTTLGSRFKSRDITLLTKVHLVKAMVFPVVMDCWTKKKAESW